MNKKIIIYFIILGFVIGILFLVGMSYKKYSINKKYEIMRKTLDEEATKYLKISHPYCTPGVTNFTIYESALLYQWGMNKEVLLDVSKKSYCKAIIEVTCIEENKLKNDVYLKCQNFEDENYSNWEERS